MNLKGALLARKSIIFSWLLSYILILLIPIAFTGIVYFITVRTIEKETNRANLAMLKQVQLNMDNVLKDAERLSFDIAFNQSIQLLTSSQKSDWDSKQYEVSEIVKVFKWMNISNGYIKDFYVYFKNMDAVVSQRTASRSSLMYSVLGHNKDLQYEQWIEMLQDEHTGSYISIGDETNSNKAPGTIAYIRSIPISNPEKALGTIVVKFNEQRYMEMIRNIQWAQYGDIFILDKDNKALASTTSYNLSDILQFDELSDSNSMMMKRKGNDSLIITYTKSDVSELKYVSIVPRKIVMEKSDFIRDLMLASILLCLIFGGAASVLLTLRNYNPIRELISILLKGKAKNSYDKSNNEYSFIYEAIQNELQEKERINHKLEQQNSVVREDFLQKLLKGKFGSKISVQDAFYTLNMQFISSDFAVVLISVKDKGKLALLVTEDNFEEETNRICFVITNVFDELLGQNYKGFIAEIDERIAYLVNIKDLEVVDHVQKLVNIAEEAQGFFMKYYSMILTVSISNVHEGISGIPEAYKEAVDAMEYKMIAGSGKTICFQSVKNSAKNYFYPLEKEQKLVNCIKSGEFEKGKELLDEIINSNFIDEAPTVAMTRYFMIDLASTVVKTVREISVTEPVQKLLQCETVEELQKEITNTLLSVSKLIQSKTNDRTYELSRNIMGFVDIHYGDVTLNVATIAEKLPITPTCMSKLFKEQTGVALPDYINKVRLKKAKVLLKDEKLSISEAAVKVGYINSNALIRSFKKYEGVTPGQYKGIEDCDA